MTFLIAYKKIYIQFTERNFFSKDRNYIFENLYLSTGRDFFSFTKDKNYIFLLSFKKI